jgi:hypothetical protein
MNVAGRYEPRGGDVPELPEENTDIRVGMKVVMDGDERGTVIGITTDNWYVIEREDGYFTERGKGEVKPLTS